MEEQFDVIEYLVQQNILKYKNNQPIEIRVDEKDFELTQSEVDNIDSCICKSEKSPEIFVSYFDGLMGPRPRKL